MHPPGELRDIWNVGAMLGEGPVWLPKAGQLAWVDILAPSYNLLDPATGGSHTTLMPGKIGSAAPLDHGDLEAIVALDSGLWRLAGRALAPMPSPDMRGIHFNDGKCDPAGRFWVGTRSSDGSPAGGALYRLDPGGELHEMDRGFDVPNGLGWSPDGRYFYLVDTVPHLLYRYDFDLRSGAISNRCVLRRFDGHGGKPDGLAVDAIGRLWCAMWDGRGIAILSAEGEQVDWLPTPCARPTSCAFGGPRGTSLYVTTAAHGLDPEAADRGAAGSILGFDVHVAGCPVATFSGRPAAWGSANR